MLVQKKLFYGKNVKLLTKKCARKGQIKTMKGQGRIAGKGKEIKDLEEGCLDHGEGAAEGVVRLILVIFNPLNNQIPWE